MTSTPTPEPERRWVCHKPGWMGACSPQSTHHNGFDWGCGWIYFPAPSTPGEGDGRPGGWVEGIGWVALFHDLPEGTRFLSHSASEPPITSIVGVMCSPDDWENYPVIVTRWADGTAPAPPASPADDVPDADAVAFQNGYRIGVRVGSEHHGPCRGLPPASPVPPTPAPQADRDKLEIDVEELLIDHCGMGGTSALTDRILALTDAFTFAAAPPSTPAERAPAAIVDDGEVILSAEGDGYVLTVQINEAGDSVSHRLTAAEVAAFAAVPPTRPGADAVIRALIAACPSYGRGEGDTFRIEESAVVRLAREFLAAAPPTPTPCPYIVTGGEGTSYCSLAERSAMHAAAPPSTPADPRPTDPTGSEA